jgi:hypothetical protein
LIWWHEDTNMGPAMGEGGSSQHQDCFSQTLIWLFENIFTDSRRVIGLVLTHGIFPSFFSSFDFSYNPGVNKPDFAPIFVCEYKCRILLWQILKKSDTCKSHINWKNNSEIKT